MVVDRYAYSGSAFSATKPGLDLTWCKQQDMGLPKPDMVIFLDVSEEVASKRGGFGEERYETLEVQRAVRINYQLMRDPSWVVVNADGTKEGVARRLQELVDTEVDKDHGDLDLLWMKMSQDAMGRVEQIANET